MPFNTALKTGRSQFERRLSSLGVLLFLIFLPQVLFAEINFIAPSDKVSDSYIAYENALRDNFEKSGIVLLPNQSISLGIPSSKTAISSLKKYSKVFFVNVYRSDYKQFLLDNPGLDPSKFVPIFREAHPLAQITAIQEMYGPGTRITILGTDHTRHLKSLLVKNSSINWLEIPDPTNTKDAINKVRQTDVVLLLPDKTLVNRLSVSLILRGLIAKRITTFGYSEKLVKIGASGTLFTSEDSYMSRVNDVISNSSKGEIPDATQTYQFTFNKLVSNSMNIPDPDSTKILSAVKAKRGSYEEP